MADFTIYKGNTAPSLNDTIRIAGVAVDLTGATVRFKMRAEGSATLIVDAAATIVSATAGTVKHEWSGTDTATSGEYFGWWEVTDSGARVQDTPEFTVAILDHVEGFTATDLCTIPDYREQTEQKDAVTTSDELLGVMIAAASKALHERYGREFISTAGAAVTRRVMVRGSLIDLHPYDMRATPTTVVLHPESSADTLTAGTDYAFTEINGPLAYRFMRLAGGVSLASSVATAFGFAYMDITSSSWGMYASTATVPDDIRRACVLTVQSWLDRAVDTNVYQDFGVERGYRPQAFTGWPIPIAAHLLMQRYAIKAIG